MAKDNWKPIHSQKEELKDYFKSDSFQEKMVTPPKDYSITIRLSKDRRTKMNCISKKLNCGNTASIELAIDSMYEVFFTNNSKEL